MKQTIVKQYINGAPVWVPAYDSDKKKMNKFKPGEVVRCTITKPRNLEYHNLFWALCSAASKNSEKWRSKRTVANAVLIKIGYWDIIPRINGTGITIVPGPLNFEDLDETDFDEQVMSKAWGVFAELLGLEENDLKENYRKYLMEYR